MNDPETTGGPAPEPIPPQTTAPALDGPTPGSGGGDPAAPGGDAEAGGAGEAGESGERRRRRRRRRGRRDRAEGDAGAPAAGEGAQQQQQQQQQNQQQQHQHQPRRERQHGPRPGPGGRHGHGHGHGHGRGSEHHALAAVTALSRMAQSLLRIEGVDLLAMPRYIELNLRVPVDSDQDGRSAAAAAVEEVLRRVQQVRDHERALVPGAVYSYFHDSATADVCRPTELRQVFDRFASTGKPEFADFVTLAIERKDPGIDALLAGGDLVLTHVRTGQVLRTQQLAEFGGDSPVFRILGQVDAGLFKLLTTDARCAFSFQLLRGTTLEGKPRLRLHAVGAADLMDLADPSILQILSRFQRRLDGEALRLCGKEKNGEVDDEQFALPLLQDLARQLSGRNRRLSRRTAHADERSDTSQRPTSKAYEDAGHAPDHDVWWDIEQSTIVVRGPKGRVHVFSPEGRHVTSLMMQGSDVERRRQQGRWRPAEPEERGSFRIQLKRLLAQQPPAAEPTPSTSGVPPAATDGDGDGDGGEPAPTTA